MKSYQIHIYSSELEPVSSYRWISVTLLQIELIAFQMVSEKTVIDRDCFLTIWISESCMEFILVHIKPV